MKKTLRIVISLILLATWTFGISSNSSKADIMSDSIFYQRSVYLSGEKSITLSAQTKEVHSRIYVTNCSLYKYVSGSWQFVTSISVPHIATNTDYYVYSISCAGYITSGKYRVYAAFCADGHIASSYSNSYTY